MTPYQQEQIENILRTARKGKEHLEVSAKKWEPKECFIHIIDLVNELKNDSNYYEDWQIPPVNS